MSRGATAGDDRREVRAAALGDEDLVAAFVDGDRSAFDVLVTRHSTFVYGVCARYFRDPADAEDAAQETFLTLWRRAETFAGTARFSTWLYRVAMNTCNDLARRRARRPRSQPLDTAPTASLTADRSVEDLLVSRELAADLRAALDRLDADQRQAIVLHDVLGMPYADIAARCGVAVGTVKSRIHRGHARLAAALRGSGADGEPSGATRPPTTER